MAEPERQWPTIEDLVANARRGIIDERHMLVRPSPAERERMRAEADAILAELEAREAAADPETARPA
jgi:hypothetical protein